jgi:hypothetical protein
MSEMQKLINFKLGFGRSSAPKIHPNLMKGGDLDPDTYLHKLRGGGRYEGDSSSDGDLDQIEVLLKEKYTSSKK